MDVYPISRYVDIALSVKAFRDNELEILKQVLEDSQNNPQTTYNALLEILNNELAGFLVYGRTPLTEYSWDIYWLIVHRDFQRKGIGRKLIERAEVCIVAKSPNAVVRVETSTKKEYSAAHGLYKRARFQEIGKLPNFYADGDDLIIFYKELGKGISGTS